MTATDLLISQDRLDQVQAALANTDHPDPVAEIVSAALAQVNAYTARYTLGSEQQTRLARALAIPALYASGAIGSMPEEVKAAADAALAELRDIRDGKFADLAPADPAPTTGNAAWGGEQKI